MLPPTKEIKDNQSAVILQFPYNDNFIKDCESRFSFFKCTFVQMKVFTSKSMQGSESINLNQTKFWDFLKNLKLKNVFM